MIRRTCMVVVCFAAGCGGSAGALASVETQLRAIRADQERQARQIEILENRIILTEDTARQAVQSAHVAVGPRSTIRISEDGTTRAVAGTSTGATPGTTSARTATSTPTAPRTPASRTISDPDENGSDDDDSPSAADDSPRPVIRAQGRSGINEPANPITLRPEDRIPVVPVPPAGGTTGSQPGRPGGTDARPSGTTRVRGPQSAIDGIDIGNGITVLPASSAAAAGANGPSAAIPTLPPMPPGPPIGTSSVRDPRSTQSYESALQLARSSQCPEAIGAFSQFLVRWPDHPYADNAMYWRGECILQGGDVRRAVAEFEGLLQRFPAGNKVPDALYKLAVCYRRLGDDSRAQRYAARLLEEFPESAPANRLRAERNP